ncbi:hypothetical protein A3C89_00390 [Candidatus Kaiserbacteria bacterium RIFCSPHIGHO2_02_FULL_50_50]|uniref:Ada DNA repair metal-binding domain-containing protein n=1 Tax=Candidatus Kaiserbacteria bacterium RIFCSPHIGHO2_02_FULL_50_50 TaxID=1798492 RepID=A0A1F6DE06_9BACT|nr:MAG: hypothetical protein A3C89_00390 [Candidatus Kaiserbacteria bacterium RIFCSPHIGHO2_02_FULL_50_50]OGG89201.1 MAG: hypothetical protein A3G62_01070 [Candidatus Kaiserbacteria bacterium RIFCSPLOWO2_12_FULL_50_10]
MIAVGIIAFEIGRFSVRQEIQAAPALVFQTSTKSATTSTFVEKGVVARDTPDTSGLPYVGAKSGRVYYPATCASATRIAVANRVYFASVAEAVAAGRTPSAQCK